MECIASDEQGCQALSGLPISFVYIHTYKAYLMPSNQTTNQLTSDKRKCFFSPFPALPLCLLLLSFSPFICFSHNAYRERRTERAKVKVFCKVFAYRRLLAAVFFCQVGDPSEVKSSSLFSQLAVRRNESMLFTLAPLT